jgi:hypothetical protein
MDVNEQVEHLKEFFVRHGTTCRDAVPEFVWDRSQTPVSAFTARCPVCGVEYAFSMPSSEDAHQLFEVIRQINDVAIARAKQRGLSGGEPQPKGGS